MKIYPLPRIGDTMNQLQLFQYAISLYKNMGHYTIKISPHSHDMKTVVTEIYWIQYAPNGHVRFKRYIPR